MKQTNLITITIATSALLFIGCGGGDSTPTATTSASTKKAITYQDGTVFGETCGDFVSSNGIEGMSLCEVGTGNIVGFVRTDTTVTDVAGAVVGDCSPDFDISLLGQEGDTQGTCALSVNVGDHTTNSGTSTGGSTSTSTNSGTSTSTTTDGGIDYSNTDIIDGEVTTTTAEHPDTPQPTCSNIQPHLLPPCTGAPGEVAAN
jgi:hypothetical protein